MKICESLDTTHRRHDRTQGSLARQLKNIHSEWQPHIDAKNAKPVIFL